MPPTKAKGSGPGPTSENEENIKNTELQEVLNSATEMKVEEICPTFKKSFITDEQVSKILDNLSNTFGIEKKYAMAAIILLFLKGAASNGTPITMSVEVKGVEISKRNLLDAYSLVAGNNFIRRLAEHLAPTIGTFAEKNGLSGELAKRINNQIAAEGGDPLTAKESAWCSSFSQAISNLKDLSSERLPQLLATDYSKRFAPAKASPREGPKDKSNSGKAPPPPKGNQKGKQ